MNIPFNKTPYLGIESSYVLDAIASRKLCGNNAYTKKCERALEKRYGTKRALLTSSCTAAIEMAAHLAQIQEGDEVIMPSYTFVSTANPFVLRGARIIFVDIRSDTQNIDEACIEQAITSRTKAIVPVHYAGVSCEMDSISALAKAYGLCVIEDAAQGVEAYYKNQALGTLGDFGCYSFHETKNYTMGEGGALLLKHSQDEAKADIIKEKGTNRSAFLLGSVDKYTWVSTGSSYLPSELSAAYLYGQLEHAQEMNKTRVSRYNRYKENLNDLEEAEKITLPFVPKDCQHNAHMFYIKAKTPSERNALMAFLEEKGVQAVIHYVPLHSSPEGKLVGEFRGKDMYTTDTSQRLLRLPLFNDLSDTEIDYVSECIHAFYKER